MSLHCHWLCFQAAWWNLCILCEWEGIVIVCLPNENKNVGVLCSLARSKAFHSSHHNAKENEVSWGALLGRGLSYALQRSAHNKLFGNASQALSHSQYLLKTDLLQELSFYYDGTGLGFFLITPPLLLDSLSFSFLPVFYHMQHDLPFLWFTV